MEHRIKLSVVVPTYRSSPHIKKFLTTLTVELCGLGELCEIVLLDDGSDDDTAEQVLRFMEESSSRGELYKKIPLKIISLQENVGQQRATLCGVEHSSGDLIVTLDDDLQHRPADIQLLLQKLGEGYELVYGVPRQRSGKYLRRAGSAARDLMFRLVFGKKSRRIKPTSFRAFRRDLAEKILQQREGFLYLSAEFFRHATRIAQIPVRYETASADHTSRYPIGRLLKTFAGLALYLPFFPGALRVKYGGAEWTVAQVREGFAVCG